MLSRRLVRTDSKSIVLNGLIGYWHYSKGVNSNIWENISPATLGNYNAAISGAVKQVDCVYFDGVNDYASIPPLNFTGDFTLELIFYYKSGYNIISSTVVAGYNPLRFLNSSGGSNGYARISLSSLSDFPATPIYLNKTFNFSMRYNSINKTVDCFEDGVLKQSITNTSFFTPNFSQFNILMGAFTPTTSFSNIKVTSFKIYNRALQDIEILQNFGAGLEIGI